MLAFTFFLKWIAKIRFLGSFYRFAGITPEILVFNFFLSAKIHNIACIFFQFMLIIVFAQSRDALSKRCRAGKVRGSDLPPEYDLLNFISQVQRPDPSWNSSTSACTWKGITCSTNAQVRALRWVGASLCGTLQWKYLPKTTEIMEANGCDLQGNVDVTVLPQVLNFFCIRKNFFQQGIEFRHLPQRLSSFDVMRNVLSGEADLTLLPRDIRTLSIALNAFSGPLDLTHLPASLRSISLGNNNFTGHVDLSMLPPTLYEIFLINNFRLEGEVEISKLPQSVALWNWKGTKIRSK